MDKNFNCTNCGDCCGPVPVTGQELKRIREKIKKMPLATMYRLKSQNKSPFDCILRDAEKNECSIYDVRPDICRMFGFYEDMVCPNNPEHAVKSLEEGHKRIERNTKNDSVVGILSIDITWDRLLRGDIVNV